MVYISTSSKGGVGKSLSSVVIACLLKTANKKFKIIELDNNNKSLLFKNSDFLNQENTLSVKTDQKQDVISNILFDLMSDKSLDYILDLAGGDETYEVLEILKSLDLPKTYLIPTTRIKKYLKNTNDVFEYIADKDNTYFVLNQYSTLDKLQDEFIYFFGDEKLGIKPVSANFKTDKFVAIPFSNSFQIAEDMEQSILDLANISRQFTQAQATSEFFKKAAGDRDIFDALMKKYWNSEKASKVLDEIEQNFTKIIQMNQNESNSTSMNKSEVKVNQG